MCFFGFHKWTYSPRELARTSYGVVYIQYKTCERCGKTTWRYV